LASATAQFDRLSSTFFVAVLAHGLIILGITFAPLFPDDQEDLVSLNVTLLVETDTLDPDASNANLLASRNQTGGGDDDSQRPTRALGATQPMNQQGEPLGVDTRAAEALAANVPVDRLVTRNPSSERIQAVPETTDRPAPVPMTAAALLQRENPETLAAELDLDTTNAANEDSDIVAPSTRESVLAAYIVGWRQRVERVGTANFPAELLGRGETTASPVVEVTIDAAGTLQNVSFVRSSGDPGLDQATLEILQLAGPFEPLPELILAEASVLRFQYEWLFTTDAQVASRVR